MNLILFGYKRCGKTYYGKKLAQELGWTFVDVDHLLEELYAKEVGEKLTCREIAVQKGDLVFRTWERKIIANLAQETCRILSVGGGSVLDKESLKKLEEMGQLVYLQAAKHVLQERMLSGELPSYLDPADPGGSFEKMYQERKPLYEAIDALIVDTEGKTEREVLDILKRRVTHGK